MVLYIIKKRRKELGITQESLSRQVNITLINFQQIENGEVLPNVKTALLICKILNIDIRKVW
ncbi:MAG: helix-turn-helix transcriptional regulator [Clostridiaceae bacterium]|nr:helix-turn-helix transcriptional regulator [Clostridiaceae bacterium]